MAQIDTKTEITVWAEYGWIDGGDPNNPAEGARVRSKGCFLYVEQAKLLEISSYPEWSFDGSSTNQADTDNSEVLLKPIKIVRDPMKERRDISSAVTVLVWCSTWNPDGTPHQTNHRAALVNFMKENKAWDDEQDPLFGLEQEYQFVVRGEPDKSIVVEAKEQGPYYCGYGANQRLIRKIAEEHARRCAQIGILLWGVNAEVAPGQWEYQTRPNFAVDSCDDLWITRWLLLRTAEELEIDVRFHPKPLGNKFNGSGCHLNFSTKDMREKEDHYLTIIENIRSYQEKHEMPWKYYGEGNEMRLTGIHETSSMDEFVVGVGNRGASIRIPQRTEMRKTGYLEDRRPAANIDPYRAVLWLLKAIQ